MILEMEDAEERLNSADNLVNKLRNAVRSNNSLTETFGVPQPSAELSIPSLPPSADELIDDLTNKLKLASAQGTALEVLDESVKMLQRNLINIDPSKPEKLSKIAFEMGRIVHTINEARGDSKKRDINQVIIYRPIMMQENNYETIPVHE